MPQPTLFDRAYAALVAMPPDALAGCVLEGRPPIIGELLTPDPDAPRLAYATFFGVPLVKVFGVPRDTLRLARGNEVVLSIHWSV